MSARHTGRGVRGAARRAEQRGAALGAARQREIDAAQERMVQINEASGPGWRGAGCWIRWPGGGRPKDQSRDVLLLI